jgi:2-polyprenyl-3-methyl-5-hydroxy-6-metoxy-1,4-benzoquinol methylase
LLLESCLCGSANATPETLHGLEMLRCECGILRQLVHGNEEALAVWYRQKYHTDIYYHTPEQDREVARLRLDAYALAPGVRLLDVGSGNNAFVQEARARGIDAWGQEVAEQADGPHTYIGPLASVHFPADYFDVVTLHDVLEHIPDPRALLREIRRLLKPKGTLIVDWPRFHDPSGAHHWKPVEHLWMLDDAQLAQLLESESFHVEKTAHPVASKTVLTTINGRSDSRVRILLPPGMGDGYWVLVKLRSFLAQRGITLPEVWVHDSGPRRSEDFWRRVPFVRWGGYAPLPKQDGVARQAYTQAGFAIQENVHGFDFFLSSNGDLEHGRSVDDAIPGAAEWDVPLFHPKAELEARDAYRARFGDYIVTAFWEQGFYTKWLQHFGEADIVETLASIADTGKTVVITGAEWDRERIGARIARADPRFIDLIGATTLDQLFGLLSGAVGVFGFPAGSTMMGPYFGKPTALLWHEHFRPEFWRNTIPPDACYLPIPVTGAKPTDVVRAVLNLISGDAVDLPVPTPVLRPRHFTGKALGPVTVDRRHLTNGLLERRRAACGLQLAPGNLRVDVENIDLTLRLLGAPALETEQGARLGALRWWRATILVGGVRADGFIVRHEQTSVPFLELVSTAPFTNIRAGTPVSVATEGAEPMHPPPRPSRPAPVRVVRQPARRVKPNAPQRVIHPATAVATDLILAGQEAGVLSPHMALVLGGGASVWDDVRAIEAMLGRPWDGFVVAANDIGCHWPRRLDFWATLHPEKLKKWTEVRRANGYVDGYVTCARQAGKNRGVMRAVQTWPGGGSSGLLAAGPVAVDLLGCTHVVLAGMPMDRSPYFAESKEHPKGKNWSTADSHWAAWGKNIDRMRDRVKSFGGRTRDLLGAPTREWLLRMQEEAA